mgnify:CR=1 FL=1|jgi:V/A-type H+-transporting ATPase subunit E
MSLAQITEKIRNDAQLEADEILSKAKAQSDLISKRALEENDSIKSASASRFDVERPEIFRRREIVANLDVKKMMLESSRTLINDVYTAAIEKMSSLDKATYENLAESLLNASVTTKEEEFLVAENEKYLDKNWLDSYNSKHGTKLVFSSEKPEIAGGFILKRGRIATNCSWDMLIQMSQEKQESDVVKRLFPSAE